MSTFPYIVYGIETWKTFTEAWYSCITCFIGSNTYFHMFCIVQLPYYVLQPPPDFLPYCTILTKKGYFFSMEFWKTSETLYVADQNRDVSVSSVFYPFWGLQIIHVKGAFCSLFPLVRQKEAFWKNMENHSKSTKNTINPPEMMHKHVWRCKSSRYTHLSRETRPLFQKHT